MIVTASGTCSRTSLSRRSSDLLGALDARADGKLGVDVDLALVGLRHQLDADRRVDQHRCDDAGRADADDRRPVIERDVDDLAVALVHAFEEAFARR